MKKFTALLLILLLTFSLCACGEKPVSVKPGSTQVRFGVLKGPTGIGAVSLMDKAEKGEHANYKSYMITDPSDMVGRITNGSLDIAALPTNTAANLYNKTNGGVKIIALNTLGVLYILEKGDSIHSAADLKGKTIYCNGQGANPEYVLNFILRQNGLEPGKDVEIVFKEAAEVTALMASGQIDCCMLPVPAAVTVTTKNPDVKMGLDLTEEYAKAAGDGSVLTMGCLVARREFLEEHPEEAALFLERYAASIEDVKNNTDASSELIASYEITPNAAIAKKSIPYCSMVCITGKDIRPAVENYYKVLFEADPASLGGSMPGDDFYYEGK